MQALGQVWGPVDPRAPDLKENATPVAAPKLYGALLLLDFWRERCADGGFVVGRDIPSRPLGNILRNLVIYEPVDDGHDLRVRIAGTALMRRFNRDITGALLSELYPPDGFERRRAHLFEAASALRPVMLDVVMQQGDQKPLTFETILLPVTAPDRRTNWVLQGIFYHES